MPDHCKAVIDRGSWQVPAIFNWLQEQGGVTDQEMFRTFNCGVGMVIALPAEHVDQALALLKRDGESAWRIGEIATKSDQEDAVDIIDGAA